MKSLSSYLDNQVIERLRKEITKENFPGVSFEEAMQFFLTDGVIPKDGLPATSFLALEDWLRASEEWNNPVYSTTDLKNKTGEIIEKVLQGKVVRLIKHGRLIAEIRSIANGDS